MTGSEDWSASPENSERVAVYSECDCDVKTEVVCGKGDEEHKRKCQQSGSREAKASKASRLNDHT